MAFLPGVVLRGTLCDHRCHPQAEESQPASIPHGKRKSILSQGKEAELGYSWLVLETTALFMQG